MNKYLLTGATGFIGQHLLNSLDKPNNNIRLLLRNERIGYEQYEKIICDFEIDEIPSFALDSVDVVFHLAGYAHGLRGKSLTEHRYQKVNIDSTYHIYVSQKYVRTHNYTNKSIHTHGIFYSHILLELVLEQFQTHDNTSNMLLKFSWAKY